MKNSICLRGLPRTLSRSLFLAMIAIGGCSSSAEQSVSRESATKAYQEALTLSTSGSHSEAIEKFNEAIQGGWLNSDARTQAYLKRAVSLAATGDFSSAEADLEAAKEREVNPDDLLVVKSYLLRKQGKDREAKAAMKQAKRFNRAAREIVD